MDYGAANRSSAKCLANNARWSAVLKHVRNLLMEDELSNISNGSESEQWWRQHGGEAIESIQQDVRAIYKHDCMYLCLRLFFLVPLGLPEGLFKILLGIGVLHTAAALFGFQQSLQPFRNAWCWRHAMPYWR